MKGLKIAIALFFGISSICSQHKINGKIIDESKDTLKLINKEGKIKTLLKSSITFKILKNNKIIEGNSIKKRPEERLKG